ncbi:MAG: hypothetical protein R3C20_16430 [Planctomycetaceae bacterium]
MDDISLLKVPNFVYGPDCSAWDVEDVYATALSAESESSLRLSCWKEYMRRCPYGNGSFEMVAYLLNDAGDAIRFEAISVVCYVAHLGLKPDLGVDPNNYRSVIESLRIESNHFMKPWALAARFGLVDLSAVTEAQAEVDRCSQAIAALVQKNNETVGGIDEIEFLRLRALSDMKHVAQDIIDRKHRMPLILRS